jgi:hypothetical protein
MIICIPHFFIYKESPLPHKQQRTRKSCGTTSIYRQKRPHGAPTGPHAVSGIPVFAYWNFSKATRKGIPQPGSHCLAATGSSLGERVKCVLGFINVLAIFTFLTV